MSKSYRLPIVPMAASGYSEKEDKTRANKKLRRKTKSILEGAKEDIENLGNLPTKNEVAETWCWSKDGKTELTEECIHKKFHFHKTGKRKRLSK